MKSRSGKLVERLAIIDEQSTKSFVDEKIIATVDVPNEDCFEEDYTLVTLSHLSSDISGKRVNDFSIRGLNRDTWIYLPSVLTHPCLPDTSEEMVSADIIKIFPQL